MQIVILVANPTPWGMFEMVRYESFVLESVDALRALSPWVSISVCEEISLMKKVLGFVVVAGLAVAANAQVNQRSQFALQLSTDGVSWSNSLNVDPAATGGTATVFARVLVSYVANGGPTPLFLNGARFQPQGSGWNQASGDTVLPYNATTRVEANYTPGSLTLGRVLGATTVAAVNTYQYSFNGQNYVRFAEANTANHPGQGSGADNVSGSRGVNTSNNTLAPQFGITDLPLFTWGMTFTRRNGSVNFTIDQAGFRTSPTTSNPPSTRSATWVTQTQPSFVAVEAPTLETLGATLNLVPAPSAAALLGLGGLAAGRRRR
jgi:hypothetical protein